MSENRFYTREQLILAMAKYNQDALDNPDKYLKKADYEKQPLDQVAINQVEVLLKFVE